MKQKVELNGLTEYIKWTFRLLIFVVVIYFLIEEIVLPRETVDDLRCTEFQASWTMIREDGSFCKVEIPGHFDVKRNERLTFATILPEDIEENLYFCVMGNRQDIEIYVDGDLRQSYSTKNSRPYGKSSVSAYVFMRIEKGDGGKQLRIVYQTDSAYSGKIRAIYYGDKMGIWSYLFKTNGVELMIAMLMVVLGVVSVVGSVILRVSYHRPMELEYLGWGVLLAASWIMANSVFRQLFFPNISLVNDLAFFMVMLLPLPFMIYLNEVQKRHYNTYFMFVCASVIVNDVICSILQFINAVDFTDSIAFIAGFCGAAIAVMGGTIIADCVQHRIHEYRLVAIGILGASLSAVAQFIMYFQRSAAFNGVLIALGLIFLLIVCAVSTIVDIIKSENEKQQAILAGESKARFLANMSHEIRTPINAVLGMDEMILNECQDGIIRDHALDIRSAGQSLLALINDILDITKIETGKMEIIPVEYQLSSFMNDCYNMVQMRAKENHLELKVINEEDLPKILLGDEVRLRQITVNLLTNAVKYTKEGRVTFRVLSKKSNELNRLNNSNIVKESDDLNQKRMILRIEVEDTGVGISKENQQKLFETFQRIDEKKNRNIEGSGLGLAITKHLVELMDGTLGVESELGQGSLFWVEIPQEVVDSQPMGDFVVGVNHLLRSSLEEENRDNQSKDEQSEIERKKMKESVEYPDARILVVDDVAMNLKVFQGLLRTTKAQIDTADSGMKALEILKEKKYDLVFLDHMMPEMDGVETFHRFKQYLLECDGQCPNVDTPVIMLTANAIAGVREEYMKEGFTDYMSKPIQVQVLMEMLKQYL